MGKNLESNNPLFRIGRDILIPILFFKSGQSRKKSKNCYEGTDGCASAYLWQTKSANFGEKIAITYNIV